MVATTPRLQDVEGRAIALSSLRGRSVPVVLLALRVGIFILMFMWTLDKFIRPQHAAQVFEQFYGMKGLGNALVYAGGALELLLLGAFLAGLWKRFSYGAILLLHAVSTFSSFRQYLAPFQGANLLFFASWPALAACLALYWLRDLDSLVVGREGSTSGQSNW